MKWDADAREKKNKNRNEVAFSKTLLGERNRGLLETYLITSKSWRP